MIRFHSNHSFRSLSLLRVAFRLARARARAQFAKNSARDLRDSSSLPELDSPLLSLETANLSSIPPFLRDDDGGASRPPNRQTEIEICNEGKTHFGLKLKREIRFRSTFFRFHRVSFSARRVYMYTSVYHDRNIPPDAVRSRVAKSSFRSRRSKTEDSQSTADTLRRLLFASLPMTARHFDLRSRTAFLRLSSSPVS